MNQNLPANCYIPILTNSDRNYMVLHVRSEDCIVFRTAEHAPFLVNLEVFQPEEIELHVQQEQQKERPRAYEILKKMQIFNNDKTALLENINKQLSKA